MITKMASVAGLAAAALALGLAGADAQSRPPQNPVATLELSQVQLAFMLSGNLGGGTLTFQGRRYPFTIGGLGVGGFGVSRIDAEGEVYGLRRAEDFQGPYAQVRYGAAAGDQDVGDLWLENGSGTVVKLRSRREGLALSLGGDAVYIQFK